MIFLYSVRDLNIDKLLAINVIRKQRLDKMIHLFQIGLFIYKLYN